jgi:integrin alpha FG-GAP repeat containing protein 1
LFDETETPQIPISIKIGDLNIDGYPDILLTTINEKNHNVINLLVSVMCNSKCLDPAAESGKRYFDLLKDPFDFMSDGAITASFMDMNNDGELDVFLLENNSNYLRTIPYLNQFQNDAFFYSLQVLNNICLESCPINAISKVFYV